LWHGLALGEPPPEGVPMAMVGAGGGIHATRALSRIFGGWPMVVTPVAVTQPLRDIVAQLNAARPLILQGYPSALVLLAEEKLAGRLTITPLSVTGSSEQFTAEAWATVADAFGVLVDQLGSSEGIVGASKPGGHAIMLASDLCGRRAGTRGAALARGLHPLRWTRSGATP
jgi:phenylacetate-coenzyme A ligase PaaK-like adenylate-forming protein